MVSSRAERGVRRTMGFKPERIGGVQALEFHSVQLREAFDVVAHAGEEFDEVFRARRDVGPLKALVERQVGDLAGARGDRGADEMFVDLDRARDVPAGLFVVLEGEEHVFLHQVVRELRHGMARSGDALADGVQWEEVAQEDPEPFHAVNITRLRGRCVLRGFVLQVLGRRI